MATYYHDEPYQGPEAIVVAIDIGTTQSAVSFAHFIPGVHPQESTVAHWPEQPNSGKIPSMVSYTNGVVKACGAGALLDFEEDEKNVAYWFKLHLHPPLTTQSGSSEPKIPPLPIGVTIERVYADMMQYLMEHTQRFFEVTVVNGAEIWARVRDTVVIVLATPNAWDIRQQATLRKAAIMASLVTEERAGQLLQFVTEAEASVHYVLSNHPGEWLRERTLFAVIDCGGSTVDTTVYRCIAPRPLSLNEACRSESVQAGGVFVDRELKRMLEKKLSGTSFSSPTLIQRMVNEFERKVKPRFNGGVAKYRLTFGGLNDNDARLAIYEGRITLSCEDLKPVFDQVINRIVTECSRLILSQKTKYVLIVGGFGESPYLRKVLSERLTDRDRDMQIILAGESAKKAAAEGAIIGQIRQFVVARVTRANFGGCARALYDKKSHRERANAVQVYPDGKRRVDGVFHMWIKKGTVLHSSYAHKVPYHVAWNAVPQRKKTDLSLKLQTVEIEVFAYEGDGIPKWCKDEQGEVMEGMRLACTLNADLSALAGALALQTGKNGKRFYRVDYEVCVYFGGTQLRAKLQWKENGELREGPVTVMPYVS